MRRLWKGKIRTYSLNGQRGLKPRYNFGQPLKRLFFFICLAARKRIYVLFTPLCNPLPVSSLIARSFPPSSLRIAFAGLAAQHLPSASHISLLERIVYHIRISTLYALILLSLPCKKLLMFFSNAAVKPFTLLHQAVFLLLKRFYPPVQPGVLSRLNVKERDAT